MALHSDPLVPEDSDIESVDISLLPESWQKLEKEGFYPDLVTVGKGFFSFMQQKDEEFSTERFSSIADEILKAVGCGYLHDHFEIERFHPKEDDPNFELKTNFLNAIVKFRSQFVDRFPWQVYDTLAALGTRPDVDKESSILIFKELLKCPWKVADGVLHSLPIVTELWGHVQSLVSEATGGYRLVHGCGCACALPPPVDDGFIRAFHSLKPEHMVEHTEDFLRHFFGQVFLLEFGMPNGFGVSRQARRIGREKWYQRYSLQKVEVA